MLAEAFTNAPLHPPAPSRPPSATSEDWRLALSAQNADLRCRHCGVRFDGSKSAVVEATSLRARRLNWCAPEVLRVPLRYHGWDDHSDVYSFGLILWEMVSYMAALSYTPVAAVNWQSSLRWPRTHTFASCGWVLRIQSTSSPCLASSAGETID